MYLCWLAYWKIAWPSEYEEQARTYRINQDYNVIDRQRWNISTQERKVCAVEIEIISFVVKHESVKLTISPDRQ